MDPLRFGVLKCMGRSPAHARYALEHGTADTRQMRLGRLAHSVYLGGPAVLLVYPGDRRGNAWKEFKEKHAGQDIVSQPELELATAMANAIGAHPEAREALTGTTEQTLLFEIAGRACRATPDAFKPGRHLSELKTTADANPLKFPYTALRLGYHAQLAFYKDAIELCGMKPPEELSIVAVEAAPPHAIAVFRLTPAAEDFGRRTWRSWFEQFRVCEESNSWPSYGLGVLDAPEETVLIGPDGEELDV